MVIARFAQDPALRRSRALPHRRTREKRYGGGRARRGVDGWAVRKAVDDADDDDEEEEEGEGRSTVGQDSRHGTAGRGGAASSFDEASLSPLTLQVREHGRGGCEGSTLMLLPARVRCFVPEQLIMLGLFDLRCNAGASLGKRTALSARCRMLQPRPPHRK